MRKVKAGDRIRCVSTFDVLKYTMGCIYEVFYSPDHGALALYDDYQDMRFTFMANDDSLSNNFEYVDEEKPTQLDKLLACTGEQSFGEDEIDPQEPKTATKNATADLKPKMRFIHPNLTEGIARAHMAGSVKYPELKENERTGTGILNFMQQDPNSYLSLSSLLDALERHTNCIKRGEWYDSDCCDRLGENTVTHFDCIGACLNMIAARRAKGVLEDDRPFVGVTEDTKED